MPPGGCPRCSVNSAPSAVSMHPSGQLPQQAARARDLLRAQGPSTRPPARPPEAARPAGRPQHPSNSALRWCSEKNLSQNQRCLDGHRCPSRPQGPNRSPRPHTLHRTDPPQGAQGPAGPSAHTINTGCHLRHPESPPGRTDQLAGGLSRVYERAKPDALPDRTPFCDADPQRRQQPCMCRTSLSFNIRMPANAGIRCYALDRLTSIRV